MTIRKFRCVLIPEFFAFAEDNTRLPSIHSGWRVEEAVTIHVGLFEEMKRAVTHLGYFVAHERYTPKLPEAADG